MKILTFDIEDWFHLLDHTTTKSEADWLNYDSRIHIGMERIYDIVESSNTSATFFVMGWMAEKYPEVIREIANKGYEIGSHTHLHQLVYEQDRTTFLNDVEKSIKTLEDCTGEKVTSFRAPGFSITEENKWAFEVLYELGITVDSSVFPAGRSHGGLPTYKVATPSLLKYNGVSLKEFPINTHNVFSRPVIFSGGGYFRLLPYHLIKSWAKQSDYTMTYFHPRDFDHEQPLVPGLPLHRRFKSYVGLKKCKPKLERFISDFKFIDIAEANRKIDWENVPVVHL
ncbi:MAG: polysaccharide deacetylase family protein [Winogradskyella sp.]